MLKIAHAFVADTDRVADVAVDAAPCGAIIVAGTITLVCRRCVYCELEVPAVLAVRTHFLCVCEPTACRPSAMYNWLAVRCAALLYAVYTTCESGVRTHGSAAQIRMQLLRCFRSLVIAQRKHARAKAKSRHMRSKRRTAGAVWPDHRVIAHRHHRIRCGVADPPGSSSYFWCKAARAGVADTGRDVAYVERATPRSAKLMACLVADVRGAIVG